MVADRGVPVAPNVVPRISAILSAMVRNVAPMVVVQIETHAVPNAAQLVVPVAAQAGARVAVEVVLPVKTPAS